MVNYPNRGRGLPVYAHTIARGIAYEETGDEDWSELETSYGGGGYRIDREKLTAKITAAIETERNAATKAAHAATASAFADMGTALKIIRDAVEELGPVAACSISRDQFEPRPIDDAEAIISGILKAIDWAKREGRSESISVMREARRRLADAPKYLPKP
jgi:hypothetical protein